MKINKTKIRSLTLIEVLITLIVLSILVGISFTALRSSKTTSSLRDTTRIDNLKKLEDLFKILKLESGKINYGTTTYVYISLPDNSPTCSSWINQLPQLPSGYEYRCSANPTNIDGTGWIPIDFTKIPYIKIQKLPVDPINKPPYYYTYTPGSQGYELTAVLENIEKNLPITKNDGGTNDYTYEAGEDKTLTPLSLEMRGLESGCIYITTLFYHNFCYKNDNTIWGWGLNQLGELGDGTNINRNIPIKLDLENIIQIKSGGRHTCAITNNHRVLCWGYNYMGQLGIATTVYNTSTPVEVAGLDRVIQISPGGYHTCALKEDGTVWCWGEHGANGTTIDVSYPIQINIENVKEISNGGWHACALKHDNSVWCWGNNTNGQLGDGTRNSTIIPVQVTTSTGLTDVIQVSAAAGRHHTCALKRDGTVWCWGRNTNGELGNGSTIDSYVPVKALIEDVKQISGGFYHTCALKRDGTVWCWGWNAYGQLGNGSTTDSSIPVKVDIDNVVQIATGRYHTCALKSDGSVWCWGYNAYGELGNGTFDNSLIPVKVLFP